jgi:hypothetical protein
LRFRISGTVKEVTSLTHSKGCQDLEQLWQKKYCFEGK